jgi:hypothetical protein
VQKLFKWFKSAAKELWIMQLMACALKERVVLLDCDSGAEFDAGSMQVVTADLDREMYTGEVGFEVFSGFKVGTWFYFMQVYPFRKPDSF